MRVRAIKAHEYAPDGLTVLHIAEDQEYDCEDSTAPGMEEAGIIEILDKPKKGKTKTQGEPVSTDDKGHQVNPDNVKPAGAQDQLNHDDGPEAFDDSGALEAGLPQVATEKSKPLDAKEQQEAQTPEVRAELERRKQAEVERQANKTAEQVKEADPVRPADTTAGDKAKEEAAAPKTAKAAAPKAAAPAKGK